MKRRKYNHLKERATDFIGDNDEIVGKANGAPEDFLRNFPEGAFRLQAEDAYFAYLDAFCNGNPNYWNEDDFYDRYVCNSESPRIFVSDYYTNISDNYFVKDDYSLFESDTFLKRGADLNEIGWFVFRSPVGDAVWEALDTEDDEEDDFEIAKSKFIGDDDIDSEGTEEEKKENLESDPFTEEKDNFIFRRMVELFNTTVPNDDEYSSYAKAYIMAVSEYEDTSYIDVVLDLQENNSDKNFIDWDTLADYLFDGLSGDFAFERGYVFYQ